MCDEQQDVLTCVNSLFQQPWWLNAVAPNQWETVTVEENNKVIARIPYIVKHKYGLRVMTQPPLTKSLGPWLCITEKSHEKQLSQQKYLMEALIERLPSFDIFRQAFSPEIRNWLPFYWNGFRQMTAYTYRIEDLTDLDTLWLSFNSDVRYNVRRALKSVIVRDDLGIDQLLKVIRSTYERKGLPFSINETLVRYIDEACAQRKAHKMLFAEDSQNNIHAALLLVFDERCAYYLLGGIEQEFAASGAMSLLLWNAIQFAATVTKVFDFEGSMNMDIERFFRKFGAYQTPYFFITKMSGRLQILNRLQKYLL